MASKEKPDSQARQPQFREPVTPLNQEEVSRADALLKSVPVQNPELDVVGFDWAVNDDVRTNKRFDPRKKLIAAQMLKLVADSVDPDRKDHVALSNLRGAQKSVDEAKKIGVGQMLKRLRPVEVLAHRVILWQANGLHRKSDRGFPESHTTLLVTGGRFRVRDEQVKRAIKSHLEQTNRHIAVGKYKSFLFLPYESFGGNVMEMEPYLRMADAFHLHILGSLAVEDRQAHRKELARTWKFPVNMVTDEEQEMLSRASVVANHLHVRDGYTQFGEQKPLTVGLETAFAGMTTRFFYRQKDGQWFTPIIHPKIRPELMRTVNIVDKLDQWKQWVKGRFIFAYTTDTKEDPKRPGVRFYGNVTMFPVDAVDMDAVGNFGVPLDQAHARITKDRVFHFLVKHLEKHKDGQVEAKQIQKEVKDYLGDMINKKQIRSFSELETKKDERGRYTVSFIIEWNALADKFVIIARSAEKQAGDAKE